MKHFKARIETPGEPIRAMEIWFDADNIIAAAEMMTTVGNRMGFDHSDVTKLIDITDVR